MTKKKQRKEGGNKLTPKQQCFAEEYIKDLNASAAAKRAGYSTKRSDQTGSRLLSYGKVSIAVMKAKHEREQRTGVNPDHVIGILTREATGIGKDTTSSARIRAAELLGKHLGMFEDRHRIDATVKGTASPIINIIFQDEKEAEDDQNPSG